jgi:hypothetical protein
LKFICGRWIESFVSVADNISRWDDLTNSISRLAIWFFSVFYLPLMEHEGRINFCRTNLMHFLFLLPICGKFRRPQLPHQIFCSFICLVSVTNWKKNLISLKKKLTKRLFCWKRIAMDQRGWLSSIMDYYRPIWLGARWYFFLKSIAADDIFI